MINTASIQLKDKNVPQYLRRGRGHQGDVQLKIVKAIPDGCIPITKPKPIALGEKSGHKHVVTGPNIKRYSDPNTGRIYHKIGEGGAKVHHIHESNFVGYDVLDQGAGPADHPTVVIDEPGVILEAYVQNQWNPYKKIFEKVTD